MSVIAPTTAAAVGVAATGGFGVAAHLIVRGGHAPGARVRTFVAASAAATPETSATAAVLHRAGPVAQRWSQAFPMRHRVAVAVGSAAVAAVVGRSSAPLVALAAVLVAGRAAVVIVRRRADQRFRAAVPELVESMGAAVRAGAVPAAAMVEAAAVAPAGVEGGLVRVLGRMQRGEPVADAVAWWAEDRRSSQLHALAVVLMTSNTFGGPLADALDDLAERLRAELRGQDDIRAQVAQASSSAVMLVCLPAVSAALCAMADPGVLRVLFTTPAGAACLLVGVSLDLAGALWMSTLIRGAR